MTTNHHTTATTTDPLPIIRSFGIGLTGGIATGKSTVANILRARGHIVIDADELARLATKANSSCLHQLVDAFGIDILLTDGSLNRRGLASKAFQNPQAKAKLDSIVHPEIHRLFLARLAELQLLTRPKNFFYEATLLFEAGRAELFREVWATMCSRSTQVQRLITLRKFDSVLVDEILASQLPAEEKAKRAKVIINTDCGLPEVEVQVIAALRLL